MMRMVLMGAPGSGKGTQGERLAAEFRVSRLSTGDALREAVREGTALGMRAKAVMDAGGLVDDRTVLGIVEQRLAQGDAVDGFILDGFPRNLAQAEALDALLRERGQPPLDVVLNLEVGAEELVRRLLARAAEQGRDDDREEVIRRRLQVYEESTRPLLGYYAARGRLLSLDGTGTLEQVFQRIVVALAESARRLAARRTAAA